MRSKGKEHHTSFMQFHLLLILRHGLISSLGGLMLELKRSRLRGRG